jgi:peptidoglycan/xylan/chitin deacetylase (PgdA/CDA1 family)
MKAFSLMYHDVILPGAFKDSGIQGADADVYKLDRSDFSRHLDAIGDAAKGRVGTCTEASANQAPVYLTFDDGGASAAWIGEELERRGWRGHFFITTDWIGTPGFVTAAEIRKLADAGHVIGSHSASHPRRLSALAPEEIARQWAASVRVLADITGRSVTVASVPGGFYSRAVGEAAAAAGVRTLFTSEPTETSWGIGDCRLLGRYFVQRGMPPEVAASFAGGAAGPRRRQALVWKVKKAAKALGGEWYVRARVAYLAKRARE